MNFPPVGETPYARLAHLDSASRKGSVTVRRYQMYPVAIPRPAKGRITGRVYCHRCRKDVAVLVRSRRRVRLSQWLRLAAGVAGAALVVAGIVDDAMTYGSGRGVSGLLEFGFAVGLFAAPVGFFKWWQEDGVRMASSEPSLSREVHSIRLASRYPSR